MLGLIRYCYKKQKMFDKTVSKCSHALKLALDLYKTQKVSNKAADICFFVTVSVPGQYKTQEICDKVVDAFLTKLKFVADWLVTI